MNSLDKDRRFPIKRWLDDPVYDPQLGAAVIKARGELHDLSEEQVHELWGQVWTTLRQFASERSYTPVSVRTGTEVMTFWSPPEGGSAVTSQIDNVGLLLGRCLAEEYPSFMELVDGMDSNPNFGVCRILAVLVLHETATGNLEGALAAANALDEMYKYIRPLAEKGSVIQEIRSAGGKGKAEKQVKKTTAFRENITQIEKTLSAKKPRERVGIIARRLEVHPSTVRRHRPKTFSD